MKKLLTCLFFLSLFVMVGIAIGETGKAEKSGEKNSATESSTKAKAETPAAEITWHKYDEAVKLAKEQNKKIFLEFTAKWCGYCKKMHATTFKDAEVIRLLNTYYVTASVDGDSRDTLNIDGYITTERNMTKEFGVTGYPTYVFLSPDLDKLAPVKGYKSADAMINILDYLKDDTYKTVTFGDFLAMKKDKK